MAERVSLVMFVVALSLAVAIPVAFADQPDAVGGGLGNKAPDFSAGLYADGQAWGTKGTTSLPALNENNQQSFDKIFIVTNGAEGQLPVGEAAPGNVDYSGGRWWAHTAAWIDDLPHPKPVLTSYEDVKFHAGLGHLIIADAGIYFQCPLLPAK
jgi:hypothetical protein